MPSTHKASKSVAEKTRLRILAAAEKVFAQRGYRAMTLREVTKQAGVNLAAVNYHFGSKTNLMRALLRERFDPINEMRLQMLDEYASRHAPKAIPLEDIYDALFRPLFTGSDFSPVEDRMLIKIIGRALTEPAEFMSDLHRDLFAELSQRFITEIQRACPHLSREQILYRFFLSVSTMIGTVIEQVRLENISDGKLSGRKLDRVLEEMTRFVVAGFRQE